MMGEYFGFSPYVVVLFYVIVYVIESIQQHIQKSFRYMKNMWEKTEKSTLLIISDECRKLNKDDYFMINSYADTMRFVSIISQLLPDQTIDIIVDTFGGDINNVKIMVDAIMNHMGYKRIYIPCKAYSTGILIAMTGNAIFMDINAHMTPIDTRITIDEITTQKYIFACIKMMNPIFDRYYLTQKQAIIDNFITTKLPYNYPISALEAKEVGLNVSCELPEQINKFMTFLGGT